MVIAIIGALLSATGFGMANVVIKKTLDKVSIPKSLTMSTLAGAVGLLVVVSLQGNWMPLNSNLIVSLLAMSIGEVALYLTLYKAFEESNVTVAAALLSSYPIFTTVISILFLKEHVAVLVVVAILTMVVGAILVSIDWRKVFRDGFDRKDLVKGLPWIILSLALHTIYFPLLSRFTATGSWEFKLLGIKIFAVLWFVVIFIAILKEKVLLSDKYLLNTSLIGVLELLGWIGLSWASSNTIGFTAIIIAVGSAAPLVTAILAYLFLKEKLSWLQYLGIVIILSGLIMISLSG